MTDPSETMYLRIKKVMESYGLQQQAFAKKLGVSPATISSIYTGRTKPSNNLVQAIHREFPEINTNWLLFEEGEMRLPSTTFPASSEQEEIVQNVVSHETQPPSPLCRRNPTSGAGSSAGTTPARSYYCCTPYSKPNRSAAG